MKKLLLILLCLPLLFTTCKKEDDTYTTSGNSNTGNNTSTWNCDGQGNCSDPGTGNGTYASLSSCQSNCDGQGWEKTFGGTAFDEGNSVQQTTDGGYIVTGGTYSFGNGNSDIYLVKTDVNGVELWSQTFGGSYNDEGFSVQQTTDGGYIITGTIALIKTDVNGVELWSQTFGGGAYHKGYSVQQTTDGGYIITGTIALIKTDGNGTQQWYQDFGVSGHSVQQTTDGGYIITGGINLNGATDVYLIKTDINGDSLWSKTFGGTSTDVGNSVQQTTDGGYIICGETESYGNGNKDVYLLKTDVNGVELWSQTFGGTSTDVGNSVQQTTDGGYIITGYTYPVGQGPAVYLIKTDANGVEQWNKTFGLASSDYGHSVQQTTDGGYIITGRTGEIVFDNVIDVYLIKTNGNGNAR